MRTPSALSVASYRGAIMNINLATGAVLSFVNVGAVAGFNIKEVRSICSSPNNNYYFMTLDSVGSVTSGLTFNYKSPHGYAFSYGIPNFGVTNQGISAMRATLNFIYTQNGPTLHKRDITTGAILATAAIPGGAQSSVFGTNSPRNSGLDIDSCGNVYVGSMNQVLKYDPNLVLLSSVATTFNVYDVAVNSNSEVIVCGAGTVQAFNMGACRLVPAICPPVVLPISLSKFISECEGDAAKLNWQTETEINCDYFEIQKMKDNEFEFKTIGKIKAYGNSETKKEYEFFDKDKSGESEILYYRLKITDADRSVHYSNLIDSKSCVSINGSPDIFPNPTNGLIYFKNIKSSENYQIEIFDSKGNKVYSSKLITSATEINFENFGTGLFFAELISDYKIIHQKIIVQ